MKNTIESEKYGKIDYEEALGGKRTILLNGKPMNKLDKTHFSYAEGEEKTEITVSGNTLAGVKLTINNSETVTAVPPCKWYEIVITIITFAVFLVWGNVPALVAIIPLVGGAIGGVIAAVCAVFGLYFMRTVKKPAAKVAIGLAGFAAAFLLCFLIGFAILAAASSIM